MLAENGHARDRRGDRPVWVRESWRTVSGHTPGPWTAVDFAIEAESPDRPGFTDVIGWASNDDESTGLANARLIAAAPELLDAVTHLKDHVAAEAMFVRERVGGEWHPVDEALAGLLEAAELAIGKAEGQTS